MIHFTESQSSTNTSNDWWWGISPEGFGTIGMLVNFGMAIAVSRFTAVPPKEVQKIVEVPIERIVDIPVEKVIERPVEIEKRVEVPYEVIVERVVQEPYENIIYQDSLQ